MEGLSSTALPRQDKAFNNQNGLVRSAIFFVLARLGVLLHIKTESAVAFVGTCRKLDNK